MLNIATHTQHKFSNTKKNLLRKYKGHNSASHAFFPNHKQKYMSCLELSYFKEEEKITSYQLANYQLSNWPQQ